MTHCLDRRWGAFQFVMRVTTSICVVSKITLTCALHTSVSAKIYIYYLIVVLVRWIRQKNPEKSLYYIMSGDRVADEQQKTKFGPLRLDIIRHSYKFFNENFPVAKMEYRISRVNNSQ